MLMATLREETRSSHDRLQRCPLIRGLLDDELSHRYYAAVLGICYGFYAPLEARLLKAADWGALGFDLQARLKAPLIESDLSFFGLEGELLRALPSCRGLPRLPSLAAALGGMYVVEGATLGGRLMARRLAITLAVGPRSGAAFYNSYRGDVWPRWEAFKAFVEERGLGHEDAVIAAASATFAALENWYHESYQAIAAVRLCMTERAFA